VRRVAAVREFNRFYTNVLGLLQEGLLETPYSLTEARVIFELAAADRPDAADLRRSLDIDAGYLSRVLARLESSGLISRRRSAADGRRQLIGLTESGKTAFRMLDSRSSDQIAELLGPLPEATQRRLASAMATVREILEGQPRPAGYVLRAPLPGISAGSSGSTARSTPTSTAGTHPSRRWSPGSSPTMRNAMTRRGRRPGSPR
jgi:DNA-binding MarR family transcriptional regulator